MNTKIDIRSKGRWTLVGIEVILAGIGAAVYLAKRFDWDLFSGVITAVIVALVLFVLFMRVRIFRYVFSILFSLVWGFLASMLVENATESEVAKWVAILLVVIFSLVLHKDYFEFERG